MRTKHWGILSFYRMVHFTDLLAGKAWGEVITDPPGLEKELHTLAFRLKKSNFWLPHRTMTVHLGEWRESPAKSQYVFGMNLVWWTSGFWYDELWDGFGIMSFWFLVLLCLPPALVLQSRGTGGLFSFLGPLPTPAGGFCLHDLLPLLNLTWKAHNELFVAARWNALGNASFRVKDSFCQLRGSTIVLLKANLHLNVKPTRLLREISLTFPKML